MITTTTALTDEMSFASFQTLLNKFDLAACGSLEIYQRYSKFINENGRFMDTLLKLPPSPALPVFTYSIVNKFSVEEIKKMPKLIDKSTLLAKSLYLNVGLHCAIRFFRKTLLPRFKVKQHDEESTDNIEDHNMDVENDENSKEDALPEYVTLYRTNLRTLNLLHTRTRLIKELFKSLVTLQPLNSLASKTDNDALVANDTYPSTTVCPTGSRLAFFFEETHVRNIYEKYELHSTDSPFLQLFFLDFSPPDNVLPNIAAFMDQAVLQSSMCMTPHGHLINPINICTFQSANGLQLWGKHELLTPDITDNVCIVLRIKNVSKAVFSLNNMVSSFFEQRIFLKDTFQYTFHVSDTAPFGEILRRDNLYKRKRANDQIRKKIDSIIAKPHPLSDTQVLVEFEQPHGEKIKYIVHNMDVINICRKYHVAVHLLPPITRQVEHKVFKCKMEMVKCPNETPSCFQYYCEKHNATWFTVNIHVADNVVPTTSFDFINRATSLPTLANLNACINDLGLDISEIENLIPQNNEQACDFREICCARAHTCDQAVQLISIYLVGSPPTACGTPTSCGTHVHGVQSQPPLPNPITNQVYSPIEKTLMKLYIQELATRLIECGIITNMELIVIEPLILFLNELRNFIPTMDQK